MTTSRFNSNRGRYRKAPYRRINESRGRRALKEGAIMYYDLNEYYLWDEAEETYERIKNCGELPWFESWLAEEYPEGLSEEELNDLLRFNAHAIYSTLGIADPDAEYMGVLGKVFDMLRQYGLIDDIEVDEEDDETLASITVLKNRGVDMDLVENGLKNFGDKIRITEDDFSFCIRENKNYRESLRSRHITRRPIRESRNTRYTYRYRR